MKRSGVLLLVLLLFGLLVFPVVPSYAWHGRGGVYIGVGPGWWGPPYPYWWYPPLYYPPAPVVIEQPPVYVEQQQTVPPPPPSAPPAYWYYCSSAQAYYPQAQSCPEAWIKVPARAQ